MGGSAVETKRFCVVCDAEPGGCEHNARYYLDDMVYEPIKSGGWKVPDHERARWDAAPLRPSPKPKVNEESRDVEELVVELDSLVHLAPDLEATLRTTHDLDPLRVSRLAAETLDGVARGSLHNPGGFLRKRLAAVKSGKTKTP